MADIIDELVLLSTEIKNLSKRVQNNLNKVSEIQLDLANQTQRLYDLSDDAQKKYLLVENEIERIVNQAIQMLIEDEDEEQKIN